jgi:crotonobetainyl-CoA:carnitine CoA-transferase CaiB-like acyl-CoA transferase
MTPPAPLPSALLAGIRVLDLTRLLPGGYLTLLLADLGADVVKVEEPGRGDYFRAFPPIVDGEGAYFHAVSRGKRSVTLNLKAPEGADLLRRLASRADVLVESFRPGVMERLDLGAARLRTLNRRLVYCAISGYGQDGPYRLRAGHDLNYIAAAGLLGLTGTPGEAPGDPGVPVIPAVQVADLAGGALLPAVAILAALVSRAATGEGAALDLAMTDGVLSLLGIHVARAAASGETARRGDMLLTGRYPCYGVYRTGDGRELAVGAIEAKFWESFCAVIGRPDLTPHAFAEGEEGARVKREVAAVLASRTLAEWVAAFSDADACVEPVATLKAALEHPQLRHRGMVVEQPTPSGGRLLTVGSPVHALGATGPAPKARRPAPRLGADTAAVLAEVDVDADALARLRAAGVV